MKKFKKSNYLKAILFIAGIFILAFTLLINQEKLFSFIWPNNLLGTVSVTKNFILGHFKILSLLASALFFILALCIEKVLEFIDGIINRIVTISAKKFLFIFLSIFFLLRLLWIVVFPFNPGHDDAAYNYRAQWLLEGQGYNDPQGQPEIVWFPAYPYLLFLIYKIFGYSIFIAKFFNILFILGILLYIYLIARKLFFEAVARLSLIIFGFLPSSIASINFTIPDVVHSLVLYLVILLLIKRQYGRLEFWRLAIAGILLGLGALLKGIVVFLPVWLFFIFILCERVKFRIAFGKSLILIVFMFLVIMPWTIRNYIIFKRFIPITACGEVIYMGNNPEATGTYYELAYSKEGKFFTETSRDEFDKKATKMAFDYIKKHPLRFIKMGFKKLFYTYSRNGFFINGSFEGAKSRAKHFCNIFFNFINNIVYYGILSLFFVALIPLIKNMLTKAGSLRLWGLAIIAYFSGIIFVTVGADKYTYPMLPFIVIYASYAITWLLATK